MVVVSLNKNLNQIIRRYCSVPIANIHVGINTHLYYKERITRQRNKNTILFVSRFVSWKGIDTAMNVFKELKKVKDDIKFICIGDGPLKDLYFKEYKKMEGLTFITGLDCKGIIEYYKKASLLLITSQYETFGITILEAMAAGLPIVASDLIVFHDRILNDWTGYLVKNRDVDEFCNRIIRLIEDLGKRKEIINNAFAKVTEYDIDKISSEYITLYRKLQMQKVAS